MKSHAAPPWALTRRLDSVFCLISSMDRIFKPPFLRLESYRRTGRSLSPAESDGIGSSCLNLFSSCHNDSFLVSTRYSLHGLVLIPLCILSSRLFSCQLFS